ncbi:Major facilitator superfamily like protein [Aduncisulcus paluster]|uniref:Major facilitator superfamily like protein n=1 Tax=Aduncisulcus paluster TaxID=2918883 RepID=A0ABQ5JX67_9EUKA|nr:Major facilitator superfamily like protein [Aduncisulcus paluster]
MSLETENKTKKRKSRHKSRKSKSRRFPRKEVLPHELEECYMRRREEVQKFSPKKLMALLCWSTIIYTFDLMMQPFALAGIADHFGMSKEISNWVSMAYQIPLAAFSTISGKICDRYNTTMVHRISMIVYVFFTAACGLDHFSFVVLVALRAFQGAAGAFMISSSIALIPLLTEDGKIKGSMSRNTYILIISSVCGPILGGIIMQWLSWSWIYYINVIPGLIGIILCWIYLPKVSPIKIIKFDTLGACFLFVSLAVITYGLTVMDSHYWVATFCIGLGLLALFLTVLFEWHIPKNPILPRKLLRNKNLMLSIFSAFFTFAAQSSVMYCIPYVFESCWQFSPLISGLLMVIGPVFSTLAAFMSRALMRHLQSRVIRVLGQWIQVIGYLLLGFFIKPLSYEAPWTNSVLLEQLGLAIRAFGQGLFTSTNTAFALRSTPLHLRSMASGLIQVGREAGYAFGAGLSNAIVCIYVNRREPESWPVPPFPSPFRNEYIAGTQVSFWFFSGFVLLISGVTWLSGVLKSEVNSGLLGLKETMSCQDCASLVQKRREERKRRREEEKKQKEEERKKILDEEGEKLKLISEDEEDEKMASHGTTPRSSVTPHVDCTPPVVLEEEEEEEGEGEGEEMV